jgi:hypothetical protein
MFADVDTKFCPRCQCTKPVDAFHRSNRRDGRQVYCKTCRKTYDAGYHRTWGEKRRAQKREWQRRRAAWFRSLKEGRPCTDCGAILDPAAMHWDHLPGVEKTGDVGDLARRAPRERILTEIAKCELVCANCHAVRTVARQSGA